MKLLSVHRHLELQLPLQRNSRDAEEGHQRFLVEVALVLASHLLLLLLRCELFFLVPVEVVLEPLSDDLLDLFLAL